MEHLILNLVPGGVAPEAHASQFDNGRVIRFDIKDGTTPYTLSGAETITAAITRADGTQETLNVTNTSSTYIDVVTEEDTCPVSGLYGCEITITDGADVIGSQNFILKVEADPYDGLNIRTITVGPADICTFETTLPEPLQSLLVNVVATQPSGTPTPSTPLPITGYSSANITRCGVNLFNGTWEIGHRWDGDGSYSSQADKNAGTPDKMPCKPNTTYTFVINNIIQTTYFYVSEFDINENHIQKSSAIQISISGKTATFTTGANTYFIAFSLYALTDFTSTEVSETGINYPATDTTYHAYNGSTVTIAFGQTVYGGVLHIENGRTWFEVTHKIDDFGDLAWTYDSSVPRFISDEILGLKNAINNDTKPNIICDVYKTMAYNPFILSPENYSITNPIANTRISVRNTDYNDVNNFKTNMTGHKIVYELATPFDIDLTPEVISAIVGTNNVYAGCGQTTVKYLKAGA